MEKMITVENFTKMTEAVAGLREGVGKYVECANGSLTDEFEKSVSKAAGNCFDFAFRLLEASLHAVTEELKETV